MDCTLGGGGHARLLLEHLGPDGRLLAIDRDGAAVAAARETLGRVEPAVTLVQAQQDLDAISRRLSATFPITNGQAALIGVEVIPMAGDGVAVDVQIARNEEIGPATKM